jgi:hypothetical protein
MALGDQLLLESAGGKPRRLAEITVYRLRHPQADVQADQVQQLARPHPESANLLHRPIDAPDIRLAGLRQPQRFQVERPADPIADEAGRVLHPDRRLAELGADRPPGDHGLVAGCGALDQFHELHHRCRVEEMHPQEPLGALEPFRQFGDWKARGVRGQQGPRPGATGQLSQDFPLDGKVLRNRLDDALGIPGEFQIRGHLQTRDDLVPLGGRQLAPGHPAVEPFGYPGKGLLHPTRIDVRGVDDEARTGRGLGDARTHRAAADYPNHAFTAHR